MSMSPFPTPLPHTLHYTIMLIIHIENSKRRAMSDTGATKEIPVHIISSSDGSEDSKPIEIGVEDVVGRSMAQADIISVALVIMDGF